MDVNFNGQAVWRKIQECGLAILYKNNEFVQRNVRRLLDLVLWPVHEVWNKFTKIETELKLSEFSREITNFITYFKDNYIGSVTRNPRCAIEFWSVFERIFYEIPTTTCSLESWQRDLNSSYMFKHPNFALFVDVLSQFEKEVRYQVSRV